MNNSMDFKKIADEVMDDIKVSSELRQKTLMRCKKTSHVGISKFLVPAACVVIIYAATNILGLMSPNTKPVRDMNSEVNIMSDASKGIDLLPGESAGLTLQVSETTQKWDLASKEEASKLFGTTFLTPEYIPEGFNFEKIQALGTDQQSANKVIFSYFKGKQSFLIIEEKTEMQNGLNGFTKIDINGAVGYLKANTSETEDNLDTEVHWFKDGVHYSVSGLITKDEAIKVALSMKQLNLIRR